jgi:hypothetical protein
MERPWPLVRPAYPIPDFCREFGVGRTTTYGEIAAGRLKAFKVRGRTLIAGEDAIAWRDEYRLAAGAASEPPYPA